MRTNTFETTIENRKYRLTNQHLEIENKKMLLSDLIDYHYSHEYVNGFGGMNFTISLRNGKSLGLGLFDTLYIQSKGTKSRRQNDQKNLIELINVLTPVILNNYLNKSLKEISAGKSKKIGSLIFSQKTITVSKYFGLSRTTIPYKNAEMRSDIHSMGLLGHRGKAPFIYIKNLNNGIEIDAGKFKSEIEVIKAKAIFSYFKKQIADIGKTDHQLLIEKFFTVNEHFYGEHMSHHTRKLSSIIFLSKNMSSNGIDKRVTLQLMDFAEVLFKKKMGNNVKYELYVHDQNWDSDGIIEFRFDHT